uniref:Uncharacterized protein n=1 Tax=Ignisphaera aggregans TaxID=334771 RepID=A0A7C4FH69_9CREN
MEIDVETLKGLLLQKGFEKVFTIERTHGCLLLLGRLREIDVIIGIYSGLHSIYAKIIESGEVLEPYWRCDYMEYFPQGLYAFSQAKDLEELAQNIVTKTKIILKRVSSKAKISQ